MTAALITHPCLCKDDLYGGTLYWGVCHKPTCINPVLTTHSVSMALLDLVFNALVKVDARGEIKPDLAEKWALSSDGLTYTFFIREGVRFHDGKELTSEDVSFTFKKVLDLRIESPYSGFFDLIEDLSAPDKYIFKVRLKRRFPLFLHLMTRQIMPEHLYAGKDIHSSKYNFHPVGTGPFCFKKWGENGRIILEANKKYFEGRPYLDRIMIRLFKSDQEVWAELMKGEIDLCGFLKKEDHEVLSKDPAFKTYCIPADCYYALLYDLDDPVLKDLRVRRAIAHAVNKDDLIKRTVQGTGLECDGPFTFDSIGYDENIEKFAYDPQKAEKLLEQSGWEDNDRDGIRENKEENCELRVLVDKSSDIFLNMALALRQELQSAGIRLKVITYKDKAPLNKKDLKVNKANAWLTWISTGNDPVMATAFWTEQGRYRKGSAWGYKNNEAEDLTVLGESTFDKNERKNIYQKIHRLIYYDQPACFLFFPCSFHAVSDRVKNTDDFFSKNMPVQTIKDWYIKEDK